MTLDYRKTFLLGFGFFGISIIWALYNSYVPIFLAGFGLSTFVVGLIMTFDNIAAVTIQPWIGFLSDNTRTRLGRRMPYLLLGAPVAFIFFSLIPFALGSFAFFVGVVILMNLAMSIFRTPTIALMPDIVPSPLRSQANGVINFMGGLASVIAFLLFSRIYKISPQATFIIGGATMLLAILLVVWRIREPREATSATTEEQGPQVLTTLHDLWGSPERSPILLFLAIFFWFCGYSAVETFWTSFGKFTLGINEADASLLLSFFGLAFIVFAIPSGLIAARVGRRRTITTGLLLVSAVFLVAFAVPNLTVITIALILGGLGWALVNINSLPMVVDMAPHGALGSYTGLYYFFSQTASIVAPPLAGAVVDLAGRNYGMVLIFAPVAMLLSAILMAGVRRGEAVAITMPEAAS